MITNPIHPKRLNPQLSTQFHLFGTIKYNETPTEPPGTDSVVYENSNERQYWYLHIQVVWYVGPVI